jgi:cytochrome bd-type quinol oxidase subunit 2
MIRNSELWGGLFWLAIGGFVIWAGRDMGLGRLHEPGPALPSTGSAS